MVIVRRDTYRPRAPLRPRAIMLTPLFFLSCASSHKTLIQNWHLACQHVYRVLGRMGINAPVTVTPTSVSASRRTLTMPVYSSVAV